MQAILDNINAGVKAGLEKARKANTVEPLVGVPELLALASKWEAQAAKVSGWFNDAGAYEDCADDLRTIIQAANSELDRNDPPNTETA